MLLLSAAVLSPRPSAAAVKLPARATFVKYQRVCSLPHRALTINQKLIDVIN